jgi:hypothetical protein
MIKRESNKINLPGFIASKSFHEHKNDYRNMLDHGQSNAALTPAQDGGPSPDQVNCYQQCLQTECKGWYDLYQGPPISMYGFNKWMICENNKDQTCTDRCFNQPPPQQQTGGLGPPPQQQPHRVFRKFR